MPRKQTQEEALLAAENKALKSQLFSTTTRPAVPVLYETSDVAEAETYQRALGRLVTVTNLYPDNPYKAGKKYGFAETKVELDALVERTQQEGA
jgi:hypothetical protein